MMEIKRPPQQREKSFSLGARIEALAEHINSSSTIFNATDLQAVSIIITGKHAGSTFHEVLAWDADTPLEIPGEALLRFFQQYGQDCYATKLRLETPTRSPKSAKP